MKDRFQWQWVAPILIYAISALEVIIMVSPFAGYFYSVYTPLLHGLLQFELTSWLPLFFLPHLARTDYLLFIFLEYLGPPLAGIGLLGFSICAGQLYYGKFFKKQLVTGGLYGRVRHPQYLCLAVSGAGFLLMWPRFFVLVTYLIMLGLYYVLARHEEEIVRKKYGKNSTRYMARIAMFNPFRSPSKSSKWRPPNPWKAFAVWAILATVGMTLSFLLRQEGISQIHMVRLSSPDITAISFQPRNSTRINTIITAVTSNPLIENMIRNQEGATYLLQIASGGEEVKHLLSDLGMKAGAVQTLAFPDFGEYIVMSQLIDNRMRVDPFALTTRIEPILMARPLGPSSDLDIRAFIPEQFYPDFVRIMF
jgi:protein-S-isoprenylcysteine O-methyltransferase Ste14